MNEQTAITSPGSRLPLPHRPDSPLGWLRDEIDRLFDDFSITRPARGIFAVPGTLRPASPAMEMVETDGGYQVRFDVPGIDPTDIALELVDGVLKLSGERHAETQTKEAGYLINERSYGAFSRQAMLPVDIDPDSLSAHMQDGVLRVDIKRSKEAEQRSRKIKID